MKFGRNIQILKRHQNKVCMPQFSYRFAFNQLFNLSNWTPKITQILKVTPHTAYHSVKNTKF